jgi:hypothetical protein
MVLPDHPPILRIVRISVNPGKPDGKILMSMIAVIPKQGCPIIYNTHDSSNWVGHVRFEL